MTRLLLRGPEDLGPAEILAVADGREVMIAGSRLETLSVNRRRVLEALTSSGRPVYGVNTGMGRMADVVLDAEEQAEHQHRLLLGRAVGGPPWLPVRDVRALFAVRLRGMLMLSSGVSPEVADFLAARLGDGFVPAIPREGIGCAGEIIPLSHAFQTFVGVGRMLDGQSAADALTARELQPLQLGPKEGLSFIQGSPMAIMHAVLRGAEARQLLEIHALATHATADVLRARPGLVQPPVSARVGPRVLSFATRVVTDLHTEVLRALAEPADSPAFVDGEFVSTASFHAADLGLRMDAVTASLVHVGELGVQRLHRMLDERFSGLNAQLALEPGPQAGLTPLHKRAVGELHALRRLATPATIGSMDTSNGQEDVQAFACAAGEQLRQAVARLWVITACELIGVAQASYLRGSSLEGISELVPPLREDRPLGPEIEHLVNSLRG